MERLSADAYSQAAADLWPYISRIEEAGLHPRTRIGNLTDEERGRLFVGWQPMPPTEESWSQAQFSDAYYTFQGALYIAYNMPLGRVVALAREAGCVIGGDEA